MGSRIFSYRIHSIVIAAIFSATALPALAHQASDSTYAAPSSPGTEAALVSATGIVHELRVDNRVTNVTTHYFSLHLDIGTAIPLKGSDLDVLVTGQRVELTGRAAGETLFVTSIRALTTPSPKASGSNAPLSVQGTLAIYHKDFFDQERSEYGLAVRDASGNITFLNVPAIPEVLQPNMKVSADGSLASDGRSLDVSVITILADAPSGPLGAPVTNSVLVIPIRFSTGATGSANGAAVNTEFQTKVAPYYNEVSYGQQLLNITVACTTSVLPGCAGRTDANGWLQSASPMPPATADGCDFTTMGQLADAAAQAAGYDTTVTANKFVYYLIPSAGCAWAGLAYIGWGHAWSQDANALWVYGHELGHNFGLWHSGSVGCGANVLGGSCGVSEYGDPFDIMGNIRQMHFNAMQKLRLGWIPGTSVKTQSFGMQTYQLSPIETGGQSVYAVKIPTIVPPSTNRTYWVEFRQPIGFDAPLSGLPNLGAQVRVSSPFETSSGTDDTQFLDMTPGSPNGFNDGTLLATAPSYADTVTGVRITVNSATGGAAGVLSVSVAMPGMPLGKTDFSGDGKTDILWATGSGTDWIFMMNGTSLASSVAVPAAAPGWVLTGIGDFNGDGKADLLRRNTADPTQYRIDLMDGTTVVGGGIVTVVAGYIPTQIGDFNGDGKADIVWENTSGGRWIFFMNGSTILNALPVPAAAPGWVIAGVGDFNGDGRTDILWNNTASPQQYWIYLMDGASVIGGGGFMVANGCVPTRIVDFDGDGKADILWENGTASRWIFFMNGASIVSGQPAPVAASGWNVIGTGDFNGDGHADLLWQNSAAPTQFWIYLLNGVSVTGSGGFPVAPGYAPRVH